MASHGMARRSLVVLMILAATPAAAQPSPDLPRLIGATEVVKIAPTDGFIDDAIGGDDQHLAYVVADAASKAVLHVVALASHQDTTVDLAPVMLHAIAIPYVGHGRAFVIGQTEDGRELGALIDLTAGAKRPVVYKLGPASHVETIVQSGHWRVAVHRTTPLASGTRHQVELYDLASGRRVAAGRPLDLDASNDDKPLEFKVNHWADGMTRAIGIKGGAWDRKEDQRTPDTEATYDLVTNRFVAQKAIEDLFEQRKRFQVLATADGQLDFLHLTWDNAHLQLWHDGKPSPVELDQPLQTYDPKSLQGVVGADGSAWIALQVDPVNPDAVARKKADPEYLDVFETTSGGKAERKARLLEPHTRVRFGVLHGRFWVLERSPSFDRGGKTLAVYQLP